MNLLMSADLDASSRNYSVCDAQIPSTVKHPMDGARAGVRIGNDFDQNAPDPACMVGKP